VTTAPTTGEWLRTAARRIARGSGILGRRAVQLGHRTARRRATAARQGIGGWLADATGALDTALRWALLAAAGWLALHLAGLPLHALRRLAAHRWLLWPAALGWCTAAYRTGADPGRGEAPAAPADDESDPQHTTPDETALASLLHQLADGTRGLHLTTLADELRTHYPAQQWRTRDVRALLAEHGVRVRDGVRLPGTGVREGVHRDDLPPLPRATEHPAGPDETAGQDSNNNSNNSRTTRFPGGVVVVSTPDDANPHRTHVNVIKADQNRTNATAHARG
jgi:hypothetical protein